MSDKSRRMRLGAALAGGAVLVTAIATQAVVTSASSTTAVTATSGDLTSAANVLPASSQAWCSTDSFGTLNANRRAEISVTNINEAFDYHLIVLQDNGDIADEVYRDGSEFPVGTRMYFRPVSHSQVGQHTGWNYTARIYTVNRETGEYSDDWIGYKLNQPTITRVQCNGATSGTDPWPPSAGRPGPQMLAAPMTNEDELPEESTEPTTEAPESTTEAPESTTDTPETTPESTTPETTTPETPAETTPPSPTADPKPVLVETVPNGAVTAGWTQGHTRVVVVDADGHELAGGRVEQGSTLHWVNDQLWIVGASENFRIMRGTDGDWRFYSDGGDLPRELQGN